MSRPRARGFLRGDRTAARALRARRLAGRRRTGGRAAAPGGRVRLPAQRPPCRRAASFAAKSALDGARARARRFATGLSAFGKIALRLGARARRCPFARAQLHARAARLRQADGDRLLRRARAVFSFTNVAHLFAHELSSLRRGRTPPRCIATRALDRSAFRHDILQE
jgi:hypothetical protein